jgi:cyclase
VQKRYVVVNAECSDYDIDGFVNSNSLLSKKKEEEMINRFKSLRFCFLAFALLTLVVYSSAQDFEKIQIQTVKLTDSVYMLVGGGGNIGVSVGKDGILLVDSQFAELVEKIKAAITKINDGPIRYLINTHMHYDHTNGNEQLGKAGAIIIAHDNVRKGMKSEWSHWAFDTKIPPYPEIALPAITYTDSMTIHFNDEEIHVIYMANAHTDGDTVVYFRKANVIHMGDIYFNGGYPFIDVPHGGSVNGIIEVLSRILGKIDKDTKVIPGHGPLSNREELEGYRDMLVTIRDKMLKLIKEGKTLEEITASKPTEEFDKTHQLMMPKDLFVRILYEDLSR